ncbi:MAG: putative lipid II flippase FtsW [Chlorobi bacterium]|jgi:cell division protein FtsW|nr:putative lipid II flippase FtsW [Chlorobiota bacterium]
MQRRSLSSDRPTLFVAILLLVAGIAFVYSASAEFASIKLGASERLVVNHSIRVALSLAAMLLLSRMDYHVLVQLSRPILVLSLVLLLFVLVEGTQLKGAVRWLEIAGVSLQPSELAKFALLFHLSVRMSIVDVELWDWKRGFLPLVGWAVVVAVLVALQPNLSTAALISALALMLLFLGGARLPHVATVAVAGIGALAIYAVGAEYRMERLTSYFGRDGGESVESYQLQQALIGFARGGVLGVGPGQSRQRDLFLPESYGDFIAAVIGEEYGLLGMVGLLICYAVIVARGIIIARHAPDTLGYLLAWAISLVIGTYALVNIAVGCGLLPTTGIPLPLVSYGGSSIVVTAAALGILLNISRQRVGGDNHA